MVINSEVSEEFGEKIVKVVLVLKPYIFIFFIFILFLICENVTFVRFIRSKEYNNILSCILKIIEILINR